MRWLWLSAAVSGAVCVPVWCGCARRVYVPVERVGMVRDTVLVAARVADTLAVRDTVRVEVSGDTVREWRVRERERTVVRADTLWRVRADTVCLTVSEPASRPAGRRGAGLPAAAALLALLVAAVWLFRRPAR